MEIYERIKTLRCQMRLSQNYVSSYLGVGRSTYAQMENGRRKILAEDIPKLSALFGVSADSLVDNTAVSHPAAELARRIELLDKRDQAEILNLIRFKEEMRRQEQFLPRDKEEELAQKTFVEAAQCLGESLETTTLAFQEHFGVRRVKACSLIEKHWKRTGPRIDDLEGLPRSVKRALHSAGLLTVGDLMAIENKDHLLGIRNIGMASYEPIINAIEAAGYDASHLK